MVQTMALNPTLKPKADSEHGEQWWGNGLGTQRMMKGGGGGSHLTVFLRLGMFLFVLFEHCAHSLLLLVRDGYLWVMEAGTRARERGLRARARENESLGRARERES